MMAAAAAAAEIAAVATAAQISKGFRAFDELREAPSPQPPQSSARGQLRACLINDSGRRTLNASNRTRSSQRTWLAWKWWSRQKRAPTFFLLQQQQQQQLGRPSGASARTQEPSRSLASLASMAVGRNESCPRSVGGGGEKSAAADYIRCLSLSLANVLSCKQSRAEQSERVTIGKRWRPLLCALAAFFARRQSANDNEFCVKLPPLDFLLLLLLPAA